MFFRVIIITLIGLGIIFFTNNYMQSNDGNSIFSQTNKKNTQTSGDNTSQIASENTNKAQIYGLAAAHPLAAHAGLKVLNQGGNAIDASIAVMSMLTLVEPQSAGFGGGAFMLYWDQASKSMHGYDGRETAPKSATPEHFLDANGQPMEFYDAVVGGKSFGVPGILAMLKLAHDEFGQNEWNENFNDAINSATNGFQLSERLYGHIKAKPLLAEIPTVKDYFFDENGEVLPAGTLIKNPDFANSLTHLADEGIDYLYNGPLADAFIETVANGRNPVKFTREDFSEYTAKKRDVVCDDYRVHFVCSFNMPSSGGITMLNILNILENFDLSKYSGFSDVDFIHLYLEASRLAYADRAVYLADPDFLFEQTGFDPVLVAEGMSSDEYAKTRAKLIDTKNAMELAPSGDPISFGENLAPHTDYEPPSTTHFSIRDKYGNVVSMTATIESHFGNHHMAGGMFLNNELTDFSFIPMKDGKKIANSVFPGKRPRSSMSPAIVFNTSGDPIMAIGSPGGSNIIGYVTKSIIGILDFDMSVQDAINLPNISTAREVPILEENRFTEEQKAKLRNMGHKFNERRLTSGINGVKWNENQEMEGGSDQRGEGIFINSNESNENTN